MVNVINEYYDRWVYAANTSRTAVSDEGIELGKTSLELFNMQHIEFLIKRDSSFTYTDDKKSIAFFKSLLTTEPALKLLKTEPFELRNWSNKVASREMATHSYNSLLRLCLSSATNLIIDIKKEYHLE